MAIKSQGLAPTWHLTTALITVSICSPTIVTWLMVPNQYRLNKRKVVSKRPTNPLSMCVPEDWWNFTENARTKNPFQVVRMTTEGFMSAQNIGLRLCIERSTQRKKKLSGWRIDGFKYKPFLIWYWYSHNPPEIWKALDIHKTFRYLKSPLYCDFQLINVKKLQDLQSLIGFIYYWRQQC